MKTSVIEVRDMLSVLSVLGVEERIGDVPGVESVTVNYAAGSATVRYDETRLQAADIKAAVHQSANEPAGESPKSKPESEHKHAGKRAVEPAPEAAPASAPSPKAAAPKASTAAPAGMPAPTDPAVVGHQHHTTPDVKPSTPVAAAPKTAVGIPAPAAPAVDAVPDAKTATPVAAKPKAVPDAPPDPAVGGHQAHAASVAKPSTPVTAAPKTAAAATPATRALEAAPVAKSSTPDPIDPDAGAWKVNALSLATTLGAAYISCAIFDLLFPPFGLLAVLAPASPLPISGSPLGFLLGFAMFIAAGLVLGALHGYATQFWRNKFR